nr:hypothetical protein Iba_chr10bCG3140 [Ipomoea batatas]
MFALLQKSKILRFCESMCCRPSFPVDDGIAEVKNATIFELAGLNWVFRIESRPPVINQTGSVDYHKPFNNSDPLNLHSTQHLVTVSCSRAILALVMTPNCPSPPSTALNRQYVVIWAGEHMSIYTCDNLKLINVVDLRSMPECLATDSGIRQSAANGEVKIIGPRFRGEAMFKAFMQEVYPKLPGRNIDVGVSSSRLETQPRLATQRFHVDHHSIVSLRLALQGVTVASGGHSQLQAATHLENMFDHGRDV